MLVAYTLRTERLVLRGWSAGDAEAALGAYGDAEVARWLAPAMDQVRDLAAMRLVLGQWAAEEARMLSPAGRWAIERREDGTVIGGATLLPLAPDEEYEVGWQLNPREWGHGYAAETGIALARWAFEQGIEQVIALVRPANTRALAMVRRIGMEWVGETEKYHGLRMQTFRLRPAELPARSAPGPASAVQPERDPGRGGPGQVTDNLARSRFEVQADGSLARLMYHRNNSRLVLLHTEVPAEAEGHGIGGRLVAAAVERAAVEGMTVVPLCPFARAWLERHPGTAGKAVIDWGADS